jgi:hypothetical protein
LPGQSYPWSTAIASGAIPVEPLPVSSATRSREARGQQRHVLAPVAQRRDAHRDHAQPVEQVLAERARRRLGREVAVGGGDDAHVHLDGLRAAHPLELLLLQHAQELGLQVEPHLADLVEQQRAAVRALEGALHALHRAGEAPLLVPEQRALDEPLGERGAVELHERPVAPVGVLVHGAREQLLARAALALQEHRGPRRRRGLHRLEDAPDGGRVADDLPLRAHRAHLAAQRLVLAPQPHVLERLLHRQLELLRPHGLGDVVDRAGLDGRDRVLDRRVPGEHDHRHVVPLALQHREELEPRDPGHAVVRDHQLHRRALHQVQRLAHVARRQRLVSGAAERVLEDQRDRGVVVDVQDGGHGAETIAGRARV